MNITSGLSDLVKELWEANRTASKENSSCVLVSPSPLKMNPVGVVLLLGLSMEPRMDDRAHAEASSVDSNICFSVEKGDGGVGEVK